MVRLFSDPRNEITSLLFKNVLKPDQHANLDGVQNEKTRLMAEFKGAGAEFHGSPGRGRLLPR